MKSFKNTFLLLSLSVFAFTSCEKTGERGDDQKESFVKFYGTSSYDQAFDIKQTSDGGFVILGNTTVNNKGTEISLMKTDEFGNLLWERNYGYEGNDEGKSFEITPDGGFMITGFVTRIDENGDPADKNICLIKTDASGHKIWPDPGLYPDSIIQFGDSLIDEEGRSIIISPSGYVIGATVDKSVVNGIDGTDIGLYVLDINGNLAKEPFSEPIEGIDEINKILLIGNSVVIVGQHQLGNINQPFPQVFLASFILESTSIGVTSAVYDPGNLGQSEICKYAVENNGNVVLLNNLLTASGDASIQVVEMEALNLTNNVIWSTTFKINDENTTASAMAKTSDGGYVITGTIDVNNLDLGLFVLKISSDGNKQWHKIFGSSRQDEQGENILQTSDGGYLILGTAGLATDGTRTGNSSVMTIKTTAEGDLK